MLKSILIIALVTSDGAVQNVISSQRRMDDAREHFMAGYYRFAFEEFKELADSGDGDMATSAGVAMADCQMAWGDYSRALETLQTIANGPPANWHRVAAAANLELGEYDKAIEHGEQALAQDEHDTRARYDLGRVYETVGRRDDAVRTYQYFDELLHGEFPESAQDAHYAGLGFYRYSVLTRSTNLTQRTKYVVQDVLQKACEVLDLSYWPARIGIADLLFEKYNLPGALEDYETVLKQNPNSLDAHLGLARIALDAWDFEGVETRVAVCLDINPRSTAAYTLLASLRMIERRFEEAAEAARQALAINRNHIEALSYLAAAQLRAGYYTESEAARRRVYQLNPKPAVMHTIIGKQLSDGRQFPEADTEFLKAIDFDPTNPEPRNELAMMYMQWGREDQARIVVNAALDVDAFSSRTFLTERLLEDLKGFSVHKTEHFEIHYDDDRDAVLGVYTGQYLESIHEELCEDYEVELPDTTIIEFFPDHRKFGVRIHGKPWIHTVGACTGRVIALDAPREDVHGRYNFANVLRHEFTHTITLAATKNRIPHWFTEGLAVLQEDRPKSWAWKKSLARRLRRDELFSLEQIDWGFIRPRRHDDRQVAYAQSEWMCEYLIERYSYDVINEMLTLFREGKVQRDVFPAVTGKTAGEFDLEFREWARAEAEDWGLPLDPPPEPLVVNWLLRLYPGSADLRAQRAIILLGREEYAQALAQAEKALELREYHAGGLKAAAAANLQLAGAQPSRDRAEEFLRAGRDNYELLAEHHPNEPLGAEFMAEWAYEHDDDAAAIRWAKKLKELQPQNPACYRILSGVYLKHDDDELALPELLELARHEEHDPDVARQIARIYQGRAQPRAAVAWYHEALNTDPYDVSTHHDLARLLDELGESKQAIHEYQMLIVLEPEEAVHHNELAFAFHRAGQQDLAKQAARKAVELDPNSPAGQLLRD